MAECERLRLDNPEAGLLFDVAALAPCLGYSDHHVRELIRDQKCMIEIRVDPDVLAAARAIAAEGNQTAAKFATARLAAGREVVEAKAALGKDWHVRAASRLEAAAEEAAMTVAVEEVVRNWAEGRLTELLPGLRETDPFVSAGAKRDDWAVGVEVLAALREAGLRVHAGTRVTEDVYTDEIRLELATAAGNRTTTVHCFKRHPDPAVAWANVMHVRHSSPKTLEADIEYRRETYRNWKSAEVTEEDLRREAVAWLEKLGLERAMLVDLVGAEALTAALAVPGRDDDP